MASRRQRGEGSVHQRQDGLYVGTIDLGMSNGKRRRKTIYGKTQREAVIKLREARKAIDGGNLNTTGVTVERWLTYWLEDICPGKPRMKPSTLRNYQSYVEQHLVPALGSKRLDKLMPADIRALHRYITEEKGLSSTTAGHAHRILGTALNDAMRDGKVLRNVVALVPKPPNAATNQDSLSVSQFAALMRYLDGDRLQSRWAFGLFTGARQGECLGMSWPHVDLVNGVADLAWQLQRIPYRHDCGDRTAGEWPCGRKGGDRCPERVLNVRRGFEYRRLDGNLCLQRPKWDSSRVIPIPPQLLVALQERREQYEVERRHYTQDHGLVWARPDGRPIDSRVDWSEWAAHLRALNIKHMELHSARHSASTILLTLGVEESVRMAILGHSEAATNRLYSHVDLSVQRKAMETYGDAVAGLLG